MTLWRRWLDERARRARAAILLAESRQRLSEIVHAPHAIPPQRGVAAPPHDQLLRGATPSAIASSSTPTATPTMPPPIAEVLRDLYEEEKKTA